MVNVHQRCGEQILAVIPASRSNQHQLKSGHVNYRFISENFMKMLFVCSDVKHGLQHWPESMANLAYLERKEG